jgi:hypothetical protein
MVMDVAIAIASEATPLAAAVLTPGSSVSSENVIGLMHPVNAAAASVRVAMARGLRMNVSP